MSESDSNRSKHNPEELPDLDHSPAPVPRPNRKWILPVIFGVAMLFTTALATGLFRFRPPWIILPTRTTYFVDFKALADARMAQMIRQAQARNQTISKEEVSSFMGFMMTMQQDAEDLAHGRTVLVKAAIFNPGVDDRDITPELAAKYGLEAELAAREGGAAGNGATRGTGGQP